jgi:hypothetical protein
MPVAENPSVAEFHVYTLQVRGIPFYVGEGRASRASDRARFVRYLLSREAAGKPVKWVFSNRVLAELLRRGEEITVVYQHQGLTREDALNREREEINRLLASGFVLANHQHNNGGLSSVDELVRLVLSRSSIPGAAQPEPSRGPAVKQIVQRLPSRTAINAQGGILTESRILERPLYDVIVVATTKPTRPGDFFFLAQEAADKPIPLRKLIQHLIATYRPPLSKKDPEMVIRVRTRDAYTRLGYLRKA